jgi:hypothetical protein
VEDLLPALRRVSGYQGCCLFGGKPGTGLAVVLWETEEAADAAATDGVFTAANVAFAALGLAIEERSVYEVVARDACGREPDRTEGGIPSR